jgi:hypothetical protein
MSRPRISLLTREGCDPCDPAKETLLRVCADYDADLEEADIDRYPDLTERYGECVPVVMLNDRVMFRGRVNERWLRLRLKAMGAKRNSD